MITCKRVVCNVCGEIIPITGTSKNDLYIGPCANCFKEETKKMFDLYMSSKFMRDYLQALTELLNIVIEEFYKLAETEVNNKTFSIETYKAKAKAIFQEKLDKFKQEQGK